MSCQAFGCSTSRRLSSGKSLFVIPNPSKKKELCEKWLKQLQIPQQTFIHSKNRVVCEDHFTESCFEDNMMARLLGFGTNGKRLKPDAVPTLFRERPRKREIQQEPEAVHSTTPDGLCAERALTELQVENIAPPKKRRQDTTVISQATQKKKRPVMVDVVVQVAPPQMTKASSCNIETDTTASICPSCIVSSKPELALTDHSYHQSNHTSKTNPLDTAFIQPPPDDSNSSDCHTSSSQSSHADSDSSYVPSDESACSDQSTSSCPDSITTEPKFIVFQSSLMSLFARVTCTECGETIFADDTKLIYNGTAVKAVFMCSHGHGTTWNSQPLINDRPAGNLIVATAIVLAGETYSRIAHFAEILSLKFIGSTQFYAIQRDLIIPSIDQYYHLQRDVILQQLENKQLVLSGDGRCDSPGYSAKYCTYTFMDNSTGVIPDFSLVQVTETTSSNQMEILGFKKTLTNIENAGLSVNVVVTDRHPQIRREMTKEHPDKDHQFDVWHLGKSIKKKLTNLKPKTAATEIKPWIPSICNHLWWCARNANGDADLLEESWKSLLYHITNRHTFPGNRLTRCAHPDLDPEVSRKKKWLDPNSSTFAALKEAITDKRLMKDIKQINLFCHTGALETYHSMMLKYCPKRQEFDYATMVSRTQMSVIDNNMNIGRMQKRDRQGQLSYATRCSKRNGRWTARKLYEGKNYDFKKDMLALAVSNQQEGREQTTQHQEIRLQLPRNISRQPAPSKSLLVDEHMSRFRLA